MAGHRIRKGGGGMDGKIFQSGSRAVVLIACLAVTTPGEVIAQGGDGFLFKEPTVTLKFESGFGFQQASSDIYDFLMAEQTIGERDFDSPYIGGELGVRLSNQIDIAIAVGYQGSSTQSELRDWVDLDDLPITQVTELQQIPVTASLKFYPFGRGRSLGRFAWVPQTISPFIGAGVGVISYDLRLHGDFVDYETYDIFYDTLSLDSEGDAFLARASAGFNISFSNQFLFTIEGRYGWSDGDLDGDFIGFEQIDLDGLQLIGGLAVRF
ncbi:MAG: hypothetical protein ACKVIN_08395 [Longimicrobiales bacterium]